MSVGVLAQLNDVRKKHGEDFANQMLRKLVVAGLITFEEQMEYHGRRQIEISDTVPEVVKTSDLFHLLASLRTHADSPYLAPWLHVKHKPDNCLALANRDGSFKVKWLESYGIRSLSSDTYVASTVLPVHVVYPDGTEQHNHCMALFDASLIEDNRVLATPGAGVIPALGNGRLYVGSGYLSLGTPPELRSLFAGIALSERPTHLLNITSLL